MLILLCTQTAAQTRSQAVSAAQAQLHEARLTAEHGEPARALTLTQTLLAQRPSYAPAWKLKGSLLEDMGRGAEAEAAYGSAYKLAPADPELIFKLGVYRLAAGDNSAAIQLFTRQLRLQPHSADTAFYLVQAYHLTGENDQALRAIQQAVKCAVADAHVCGRPREAAQRVLRPHARLDRSFLSARQHRLV